jgi:NAD(P)-dependent dehydrogenase (short-subunit alcohol dehydrogenase family)
MKTVLITGGSSGIGEGLVKAYVESGFQVYNFDITSPSFVEPNALYISCDLSDKNAISKAFEQLPHIDVLINNAATYDQTDFLNQTLDELSSIINTNLLSAIQLSQLYANQFEKENGRIILIASTRAFMSEANTVGYTVSKGGLTALVHSLAITLQEKHITVNAVAPGWINSHDEKLRTIDHKFHPSNRVGKVEDIVRTCMFLTDEKSTFINGETLVIDGGVTKKMIYPEDEDDFVKRN